MWVRGDAQEAAGSGSQKVSERARGRAIAAERSTSAPPSPLHAAPLCLRSVVFVAHAAASGLHSSPGAQRGHATHRREERGRGAYGPDAMRQEQHTTRGHTHRGGRCAERRGVTRHVGNGCGATRVAAHATQQGSPTTQRGIQRTPTLPRRALHTRRRRHRLSPIPVPPRRVWADRLRAAAAASRLCVASPRSDPSPRVPLSEIEWSLRMHFCECRWILRWDRRATSPIRCKWSEPEVARVRWPRCSAPSTAARHIQSAAASRGGRAAAR